MKKVQIKYIFHNPNSDESTIQALEKLYAESLKPQMDAIIQGKSRVPA